MIWKARMSDGARSPAKRRSAAGLPLVTVAQVSGTSATVIANHYGHLVGEAARRALTELTI
jgi:hypothetical protein